MNKTRRAFGLSSLGFGAALASARPGANTSQPGGSSRLHEDPNLSCFEANLSVAGNSDILASFARALPGSDVGEIMLTRSNDGGSTWRAPAPLFSTGAPRSETSGYQHAALTHLTHGAVIACTTKFAFLFDGKVAWRRGSQTDGVYIRLSTDNGHHWGQVQKIDTTPFRRVWTRSPIVEMPNGSLLLPLAGQKRDGYNDFDEPMASFLLRSDDLGATWKFHSVIAANSADYDEPAMVSLGGGRLVCALRSHESPRHDPLGGYIQITDSSDGGTTWSKPRATSMWGHPANLLRLRDGRVLCTYGYRMHPNPGVRACISPNGQDWKPSDSFAVNSLPDVDSDRLHIGCPSSVELEAGRILTAYQVWSAAKVSRENFPASSERQCLESIVYRV